MKILKKSMYVVISNNNVIFTSSLSHYRKTCISKFLEGSDSSWNEFKKIGWKCKKVNVEFNFEEL